MLRPCRLFLLLASMVASLSGDVVVPESGYGDFSNVGVGNKLAQHQIAFAGTDKIPPYGDTWRAFWGFQLPITGPVTAASLEFAPFGYLGSATSETFVFTGFTVPLSSLNQDYNSANSTGVGIYNAIGSGTVYGQIAILSTDAANLNSVAQPGNQLSLPLNSAALNDINASLGGTLLIGAYLASDPGVLFNGAVGGVQFQFFDEKPNVFQLDLVTTPEPSSAVLVTVAGLLFGLGARMRIGRGNRG